MRGVSNILNYWRHLSASKMLAGGVFALAVTAAGGGLLYQQSNTNPALADMDLSCFTRNTSDKVVDCSQQLRNQVNREVNRNTRDVGQKVSQIKQEVQVNINRASAAPDNTDNALVRGGTPNKNRAIEKYNSRPEYKKILNSFGLNSPNDIRNMKEGFVTRDGRVIVDGEVVATNAQNTGNHFRNADRRARVQGLNIYTAPTQQTFKVQRLQAWVKMDGNGQFVVALLKSCGNIIKAEPKQPPKPVQVCNPRNGKIITVPQEKRDQYAPKNSNKCKPVKVCDPETGKVKTVKRAHADKYEPVNSPECKPKPEEKMVEVCDPETGETITVPENEASDYPAKDAEECQDQPAPTPKPEEPAKPAEPEVPEEIPATGAASVLAGLMSASGLAYGAHAFGQSRRKLNDALKR